MPWELAYLLAWGRQLDGLLLRNFSKELSSRGWLSLKVVCGGPDLMTKRGHLSEKRRWRRRNAWWRTL